MLLLSSCESTGIKYEGLQWKIWMCYLQNCALHTLQVMGFKGVPILVGHPAFDIVKGTVIYYLHCVLLGVEIIRRPPRSPKERKHWKGDR